MPVRTEKSGHVWTVVLSRPQQRNAVDHAHAEALHDAFVAFDRDPEARVAVFWGEGGVFCAGWDLKSAAAAAGTNPLAGLDMPSDPAAPVPRGPMGPTRLELAKPVIAAIEGPAVAGGMELAMWADCRVLAEDAYLGVYCRRWGVPLIDGGTVRLPRLVGLGKALDIIMTGRKVPADEAYRIGLAERVVPPGTARASAEAMAAEVARFPQACMRADRQSAYAAWGRGVREGLTCEWINSANVLRDEGIAGAARFAGGKGRGGDFAEI